MLCGFADDKTALAVGDKAGGKVGGLHREDEGVVLERNWNLSPPREKERHANDVIAREPGDDLNLVASPAAADFHFAERSEKASNRATPTQPVARLDHGHADVATVLADQGHDDLLARRRVGGEHASELDWLPVRPDGRTERDVRLCERLPTGVVTKEPVNRPVG
jgi:hypothetical protein